MVRLRQCRARAIIIERGDNISILKSDAHAHNREETQVEIVRFNLKRVVNEYPEVNPGQVLRKELHEVPSGVLNMLPERGNLNKS